MGAAPSTGLSPLARGLRAPLIGGGTVDGIIPARAGFTRPSPGDPSRSRDHPRSRGVYVRLDRERPPAPRIIPARAGFTWCWTPATAMAWDHPRSRGVYLRSVLASLGPPGSSPLARGLPGHRLGTRAGPGIIPARAGFTSASTVNDRPRPGSSPLARGLRGAGPPLPPWLGIIPARAGFTCVASWRAWGRRDHPRSRGVYSAEIVEDDAAFGSSPLARGLLGRHRCTQERHGIIPARAGFTPGHRQNRFRQRDHPRSRGVYPPRQRDAHDGTGSSPLARGLQLGYSAEQIVRRIIPARAGFTAAST